MSYADDIATARRALQLDPYGDTDSQLAELHTAVELLLGLVERLAAEREQPTAPPLPVAPQWWHPPPPWWLTQPTCGWQQ